MQRLSRSAAALALAIGLLAALAGCRKDDHIPDGQVFERYESSTGHYQLEVPQGWDRQDNGAVTTFADGRRGISIGLQPAAGPPTAASVRELEAKSLEQTGRDVKIHSVEDVALPGGSAVMIRYSSSSDPEPITGKQVAIENQTILFFSGGTLAAVTLWSPAGARNEAHWDRVAKSFRWL
jgi:hypothetical protein